MTHSWPLNLAAFLRGGSPEVANLVEEGTAEMAKVVDKDENMERSWLAMDSLSGQQLDRRPEGSLKPANRQEKRGS